MQRAICKTASLLPIGACFFSLALALAGQSQTVQPQPQPQPYLHHSFAALTGGTRIRDVTLTGTATYYGGSNTESGTAVLTAVGIEQSKFSVSLPSGARTETRSIINGAPTESGTGPAGVFYTFGSPDLLTAPAWFYPAFVLAPGLASPRFGSSYVGWELKDGVAVVHLKIWRQLSGVSPAQAATTQLLSTHDIYLDVFSLLPVAIAFNLYPNGAAAPGVPVEIHFSDYRRIQARQVAYHIQAYVQGVLLWDIQLSSDEINTGPLTG